MTLFDVLNRETSYQNLEGISRLPIIVSSDLIAYSIKQRDKMNGGYKLELICKLILVITGVPKWIYKTGDFSYNRAVCCWMYLMNYPTGVIQVIFVWEKMFIAGTPVRQTLSKLPNT